MSDNIDIMINNNEKADNLEKKTSKTLRRRLYHSTHSYFTSLFITDDLKKNAEQFEKSTDELKKVVWWKNMKLWAIIIAIIVIIIIVIVVVCVVAIK